MQRFIWLALAAALTGCSCFGYTASPAAGALFGDQAALSARLAGLKQTGQNDVFCGEGAGRVQLDARFYGERQDMLTITIPAISPKTQVLDCGWTRAGPRCEAGTLTIMFHQLGGGTTITEDSGNYTQTCEQVKIS